MYINTGILFDHEKGRRTDECCTKEPQKHHTKWKEPDTKHCMLCDAIYMERPEQASLQREKEICGGRGRGEGGMGGDC